METSNDDFIIGLVKGKLGSVTDRLQRERPGLAQDAREAVMVRLAREEVAEALSARPDLARRFGEIAAEHFLRAMARELLRQQSP